MLDELTVQDVTLAIRNGEMADGIDKIIKACQDWLIEGQVAMRWRLTVEAIGLDVTEDDLTLAMAKTVEKITGHSWAMIDPHRSAGDCSAIAVAVLHHRDDLSLLREIDPKTKLRTGEWVGDAVKAVDALPMSAFVDGLETFQVSPAPLDQGSSTPAAPDSTDQPLSESAA